MKTPDEIRYKALEIFYKHHRHHSEELDMYWDWDSVKKSIGLLVEWMQEDEGTQNPLDEITKIAQENGLYSIPPNPGSECEHPMCTHCSGKGTVHYQNSIVECPVCHGEGNL
jgi:hypothetical protein